VLSTQLAHRSMLSTVVEICTRTIGDFEMWLNAQEESDTAIRRLYEEEEHDWLEQKCLTAKKEEQEWLDKIQRLEADCSAIEAAECELAAKKKALHVTEKAVVDNDDNNNNNDDNNEIKDLMNDGSNSAPEQQAVRSFTYPKLSC
jgi:hypothetical protein